VRFARFSATAILATSFVRSLCAPALAQDLPQAQQQDDIVFGAQADAANLEGCQVIARIDNQIVFACDVLWRVNMTLESHLAKLPADQVPPPEQLADLRQQLMHQEVIRLVDQKLIYDEFRRNVPAENLPRIDDNLRQPFEEHELPQLMEKLKVGNQRDLELEIARLGSSMADVRRSFNERVIAKQWVQTKVEVNEEVSPDEMLQYYQAHLADYEYPTQARWEELMVRKSRFQEPREAYAEIARLGNEVWQRGNAAAVRGPAFAEVAKANSDGFTAKEGGVRKWTTKGALKATAIDEALFTLAVGQMSPILESEEGFHIVRVLERKEAGRRPFTEVQSEIRKSLKEQRFQAGVENYLAKLRRDARIWTSFTGYTTADELLGSKPDDTRRR
jgi:parvulin-like peptidyl-prolyl isomerase